MPLFFIPEKENMLPSKNDFSEAARYLGYSKVNFPDQTVSKLIEDSALELFEVIKPQSVYESFSLQIKNDCDIYFADTHVISKDLGRNLKDCDTVTVLASTIGPQVDTLIRKYQNINQAKAAVLQACGAMFIEKNVDLLNDLIKTENFKQKKTTKPRFSPGFGDLSLGFQKEIFRLLPCTKIGLTLMDTLIMSPEKSVTALIGTKKT